MANPSDTGNSGVGTETLRRSYVEGTGEAEQTVCTGVANHIITIISTIICSVNGPSDSLFDFYIDRELSGTDIYLIYNQDIGAKGTFIFNDKIILTDTDKLLFKSTSVSGTASCNIWCNFIDQEFTT